MRLVLCKLFCKLLLAALIGFAVQAIPATPNVHVTKTFVAHVSHAPMPCTSFKKVHRAAYV